MSVAGENLGEIQALAKAIGLLDGSGRFSRDAGLARRTALVFERAVHDADGSY